MQTVTKISGKVTQLIHTGASSVQVYNEILQVIAEAPTIDAVPVVRCKDCKCGKQPETTLFVGKYVNCALYDPMPMMRCNDFCSYGERREGE